MKNFKIIPLLFGFSFFVFFGNVEAAPKDVVSKFYEANLSYKDGEYRKAIDLYEDIVRLGFANGVLYYNLGNSYFKIDDLGRAIVNYERAKFFIPRDGDLRSNEQYAYSLTQAHNLLTKKMFLGRIIEKIRDEFTCNEIVWFLLALYIVLGFFVVFGMLSKWPKKKIFIISGIFIVIIVFGSMMLITKVLAEDRAAIIMLDTDAKFEPQDNATTHFSLVIGSRINVVKAEDNWAKIERLDGKLGWIKAKDFEMIHLH
ncbi:MAG: hypothetical protein PHY73_06685 [Candidatus Omnitrophica bacterium]|nr:hypothetical protein [Candidatus Omnitrophota bacterium]